MTITPRGSVIFATDITPKAEQTASGLILADLGYARPIVARIYAAGDDVKRVGRGDVVVLMKHDPSPIPGEDGICFHEAQIRTILDRVDA